MINSTKDYIKFKNHPSNRKIDEINLRRIIKSIQTKNLLSFRPIIVNKDFEVIDGQHRLQAAKTLNYPIYYIINDVSDSLDIQLLNVNQKSWSTNDYLNFYVNTNRKHYVNLDKYIKEKNIHLNVALLLFRKITGAHYKQFKKGGFIFPDDLRDADRFIPCLQYVQNFWTQNSINKCHNYFSSSYFINAFLDLYYEKEFVFDTFIKKLDKLREHVKPCLSTNGYKDLFRSIYNYRNSSPLKSNYDKTYSSLKPRN